MSPITINTGHYKSNLLFNKKKEEEQLIRQQVKALSEDQFVEWAFKTNQDIKKELKPKYQREMYERCVSMKKSITNKMEEYPYLKSVNKILNDIIFEFNTLNLVEFENDAKKILYRIGYKTNKIQFILEENTVDYSH